MIGLRRALAALAAIGFVLGVVSIVLVLTSDHQAGGALTAVFGPLTGWAFVAAGIAAWARRPENRLGALLVAVGFTWFFGALTASDNAYIFSAGFLLSSVPYAVLSHLLLAYPTGRLESRFERALIAGAYLVTTVLHVPAFLFHDHRLERGCERCPENVVLIRQDDALAGVFSSVQAVAALALIAALGWLLARRWQRASRATRRELAPVLVASGAVFTTLVLTLLADLTGLDDRVEAAVDLATFVLMSTIPFAFLAGLLRSRLARAGAVSALVERLGSGADRRAVLRRALQDALDDPAVDVAYWDEEGRRYVDSDGRPAELPAGGSGRAWTPVEHDGRPVAAILHGAALAGDRGLVRAVGAAAALALDNERLEAALRARVEDLRASRQRIVEASDAGRRRLERDLHDGAQQRLVALALELRLARAQLERDPEAAAAMLVEAERELGRATEELRELARGIHPALLADRGLGPALDALAGRAPVPVELAELPAERLPAPVESAAYFVVAEALTNVARYAKASRAEVRATRRNGRLVVEVRDDGIGGADAARGSGLRGLEDRVSALDGRLEVVSPPGSGTVVRAELPTQPDEATR